MRTNDTRCNVRLGNRRLMGDTMKTSALLLAVMLNIFVFSITLGLCENIPALPASIIALQIGDAAMHNKAAAPNDWSSQSVEKRVFSNSF